LHVVVPSARATFRHYSPTKSIATAAISFSDRA
jgi:hypothetical protein